jgi:uncharacterized membrane protein
MLEENFEIILYMFMGFLCVFWTSMAVSRPIDNPDAGSVTYDFLAFVFWSVFSAVHLLSSVGSSFLPLAYLYGFLASAFLVLGLAHSVMAWNVRSAGKEWE